MSLLRNVLVLTTAAGAACVAYDRGAYDAAIQDRDATEVTVAIDAPIDANPPDDPDVSSDVVDVSVPDARDVSTAPATFGNSDIGTMMNTASADKCRVSRFHLDDANVAVTHMFVYLDGLTPNPGTQNIRGVIYAPGFAGSPDRLLCQTAEIRITQGDSAGWRDLPITGSCVLAASGEYFLGMHTGQVPSVLRYGCSRVVGAMHLSDDVYSDGPSEFWTGDMPDDLALAVYASYVRL